MNMQTILSKTMAGTFGKRFSWLVKRLRGSTKTASLPDMSAEMHKLFPRRDGADIYACLGGECVKLSPLQAHVIAQSWANAIGGAYISERNN